MALPRGLLREQRQRLIVDRIRARGAVKVSELSRFFQTSDMTIRRDLSALEAARLVRCVHGGAMDWEKRPTFNDRAVTLSGAKAAIARRAAELIEPGESVFVDMGSTAFAVAQELAQREGLSAFTSSIRAARELARTGKNQVVIFGGTVHGDFEESTVVGEFACQMAQRLRVDKAIFGVGGITVEHGMSYFDLEEVQVRAAVLASARIVIVVADHSKFRRDDMVTLAPLERIDVIVTDAPPPKPFAEHASRHNVGILVA